MVQIRCLYCKKLVELPAKICPFCQKSLSGVAPTESEYNKAQGDDPLLPTTFEKKAGVPPWVLLLGALALVWVAFFVAPILFDASPRDKKSADTKKMPPPPSIGEVVLAPTPVVVPTIRDNVTGTAAQHNAEFDQILKEESHQE